MIIPVRCFTCGKVLGNKWETYLDELMKGHSECDVLDQLGVSRYCCRRVMLTHVELIEKLLNYDNLSAATILIDRDRSNSPSPDGGGGGGGGGGVIAILDEPASAVDLTVDHGEQEEEIPIVTRKKKVLRIVTDSEESDADVEAAVDLPLEITSSDPIDNSKPKEDEITHEEKAEEVQTLQIEEPQIADQVQEEEPEVVPQLSAPILPSTTLPSSPLPSSPQLLYSPRRQPERSPPRRLNTSPTRKRIVDARDSNEEILAMDIDSPSVQDKTELGRERMSREDDEGDVKKESNEEKVEDEKKEEIETMDMDKQDVEEVKSENDEDDEEVQTVRVTKRSSMPWMDFNE